MCIIVDEHIAVVRYHHTRLTCRGGLRGTPSAVRGFVSRDKLPLLDHFRFRHGPFGQSLTYLAGSGPKAAVYRYSCAH